MSTRRKPTKTLRPKPRERKVRLRLAPQLTRSEIGQLQARTTDQARSVSSYVARLIVEELTRG
jgi:hypothetical protein